MQGSSEAVSQALQKCATKKVGVKVLDSGVGVITESDVLTAAAGKAIIVGFHTKPETKVEQIASQQGVNILLFDIIYEAVDKIREEMATLLAPIIKEKPLGKAEVRQVFNIPKVGTIAGSAVTEGVIKRSAHVRVMRDRKVVHTGKIVSLKRLKDDVARSGAAASAASASRASPTSRPATSSSASSSRRSASRSTRPAAALRAGAAWRGGDVRRRPQADPAPARRRARSSRSATWSARPSTGCRARFNVSIAEVAENDLWQRSVLGVTAVGNDHAFVNETARQGGRLRGVDARRADPGDRARPGHRALGRRPGLGDATLAEAEGGGHWGRREEER